MAATSLLARLGLRISTLGSAASLAIAAPIAEGDVSQAAHTYASRTGWFFPAPDSIGTVTNGVERMRVWASGGVSIGTTHVDPGEGDLALNDVLSVDSTRLDVRGRAQFVSFSNTSPIAFFGHPGLQGVRWAGISEGVLLESANDVATGPSAGATFLNFYCNNIATSVALDIGRGLDRTSRLSRTVGGWGVAALTAVGRDEGFTDTTQTLLRVANRNPTASLGLTGGARYFEIVDRDTTLGVTTDIFYVDAARNVFVTNDLTVSGKLTVAGLIDPTGMQFTPVAANPGTAPTLWSNSADADKLYYGASPVSTDGVASLTATYVGYGSATNLLTGDAGFTYDDSTSTLSVANAVFGGVVVSAGTIYAQTDTLTDAATVNYVASTSDNFTLLLTSAVGGTRQLATPTDLVSGMRWVIRVKQPASGGPCALTFSTDYKFPFGLTPTLSTAADAIDTISCYYDGTVILAQVVNSYGTSAEVVIAGDSLVLPNDAISTNTTLDASRYTVHVDASAGPVTITLPSTSDSGVPGRVYNIKKVDATANAVIIQRSGADVIDGATSVSLTTQYQTRSVHARTAGGAWDVI